MSTQVMDQVTSKGSLTADQLTRAAEFAQKELQHASDAASAQTPYSGTGTVTYSISISESSGGFVQIGWSVSSSLEQNCIQSNDWVGVFTNNNQAAENPNSNFLGGPGGWTWASQGSSLLTDVAIQQGMVAAYVIKNSSGDYVAVAISPAFQG